MPQQDMTIDVKIPGLEQVKELREELEKIKELQEEINEEPEKTDVPTRPLPPTYPERETDPFTPDYPEPEFPKWKVEDNGEAEFEVKAETQIEL